MDTGQASDHYFLPKVKAGTDEDILSSIRRGGVDSYLYAAFIKIRQTNPELVTSLKNFIKTQNLSDTEIRAALQSMVFTHELLQKQYFPTEKPVVKKSKSTKAKPSVAAVAVLLLTLSTAALGSYAASSLSQIGGTAKLTKTSLKDDMKDICQVLNSAAMPGCIHKALAKAVSNSATAIIPPRSSPLAQPPAEKPVSTSSAANKNAGKQTSSAAKPSSTTASDAPAASSSPPSSQTGNPPASQPQPEPQPEPQPQPQPEPQPEPQPSNPLPTLP